MARNEIDAIVALAEAIVELSKRYAAEGRADAAAMPAPSGRSMQREARPCQCTGACAPASHEAEARSETAEVRAAGCVHGARDATKCWLCNPELPFRVRYVRGAKYRFQTPGVCWEGDRQ